MSLDNKGYSLLELLLVLTIVLVISTSVLYANNQYVERHTFDLFYNQLKLDAIHTQMTAVEEKRYVKLIFNAGGTRYIGRKSLYEPLFERNLPAGYSLSSSSTLTELAYLPNGTIEKFGTIAFVTPGGIKIVRVFIGKGRMSLE
ncbi:prepilin-type N-terminal cleavage/methylation domain-containing protein [Paenisporosarcina sp. HGH0030]|uniref:prepilin-type N-terminal cleavage/methylation domain-containing protein n=1 Tax=Paenisporosarcina sp. HGH0030 TaxID=1078085 RepID=UPI002100A82B|nr:prepilin-type N-terminal cleavage/methylation domain-containing protein [Paenisporosarcina sp. HGH0030]